MNAKTINEICLKYFEGLLKQITKHPKKLLLPALILFFGTPLAALILCITIIGLPLAVAIFAIWIIIQYLAKIIAVTIFGYWIIKFFRKEKSFHLFWALGLGVVISYLLFSLPLVGGLLNLLASLIGLGAIYLYATNKSRGI